MFVICLMRNALGNLIPSDVRSYRRLYMDVMQSLEFSGYSSQYLLNTQINSSDRTPAVYARKYVGYFSLRLAYRTQVGHGTVYNTQAAVT